MLRRVLLLLVLLGLTLVPPGQAQTDSHPFPATLQELATMWGDMTQAQTDSHPFPATGQTVSGAFWAYWQGHGGLAQQGYPLSAEFPETSPLDGQPYTVQYFERAVFEHHPANAPPYDTLLAQLGTFRYQALYPAGAPGQQASADSAQNFPATGKHLGGRFRAYWVTHGGLAQQGFPISEEFTEISPLDGQPYRVQYFERAVFEAHPANAPPYDVLLAQLGTFRYHAQYPTGVPTPAAPATPGSLTGGPPPPPNTYQGCPATGDGGDRQLNARKNRVDRGLWRALAQETLLGLPWPRTTDRRNRAGWSAADTAAVAAVEGSPVQVEGYLAGMKVEGTESTNCHSAADVDYHLWLVSGPAGDRSQSLVAEITPRVRAGHPAWDSTRIRPLVDGHTKVRLSGWLMLDQEHPEQLGATRATLWEIHPVVDFAVQQADGSWQALDGGAAPAAPPLAATETPTLVPAAPTATITPVPAPVGAYQAGASVSNTTPAQNSNVTVSGQLLRGGQPLSGVTMQTTWHYKTTMSYCSGTTGADGVASCTRGISRATAGYFVAIDVAFVAGSGAVLARASTGFTPH